MKKFKVIVGVLLMVIPVASFAGTQVQNVTIKILETGWGAEGAYITINETVSAVEGCTDSRYFMDATNPLFKENMSLLVSAFHAKSKVHLYVTGCYSTYNVHQINAVATEH